MCVHVKAVICDGGTADGMQRLRAHVAKVACGDVGKIWTQRGWAGAELRSVLVGIARYDEAWVGGVNDFVAVLELAGRGVDCATHGGKAFRFRL